MVGKKQSGYRNYYCGRTSKAKALCGVSNGHSATKLEKAVLDYLGQFSDPEKVRELVEQGQRELESRTSLEARQKELKTIETRIQQLDDLVLRDIDRLDRGILTEDEFTKISEVRRSELSELREKHAELNQRVQEMANQENLIEKAPVEIRSFFEDFQELDIQQQKARLQQILKAAYIWNDNRIELEFRH